MIEIIPAILTSDPLEMDRWLCQIRDSGKFSRVQIDFVDGQFAANLTITPAECDLACYPSLKFDAHLMVVEANVAEYAQAARQRGFDRIIAQVEKMLHPESFSALALDLDTDVSCIDASMHQSLELILLMAVKAGGGGQKFNEGVLSKVSELSELRRLRNYKYHLGVDGGVEKGHLPQLEGLGVDEVVVGVKRVLQW